MSIKRKVQVWIYGLGSQKEMTILLLKTNAQRDEFWQPVTGEVEDGEADGEAALREAKEETGIHFTQKLLPLSSFEFESRWGARAHEQGFGLEAPLESVGKPIMIDPGEHSEFAWVSAEEARKRTKFESNRKILDELLLKIGEKHGRNN
jgi:8-oxo-dGTP pyrophosphatase MutT (NUDIX family)